MLQSFHIVFPDGDSQEIQDRLKPNQLVDLNGNPLGLPLTTARMIVYRVWKITTRTERQCEETSYHLELVKRPELEAMIGRGI